ncbi:MAG TPA: DUF4097 family beta strand repeat-containing protein [Thermoanaerobaculia bacterium]|nr:DUF4097 family beta strand repeat-containing protein [Thermoanaerobaculia bacterium]
MITRRLKNLFLGAALFGVATLPAQAATVHKVVSGVYPLAGHGTLDLSNVNGSITIETWDRAEVEVRADKIVKSPSEEEANKALDRLKVIVDAKPNRVKVEARFPNHNSGLFSWLSGRSIESKVEFKVRIPREADLRIDNVNGGITLQGGKGDLHLTTINGSVHASDTSGTLTLESTNGSIEARHIRGSLEAETVNGRVEADLSDLGTAKTSLESTNGSLTLRLPASTRANLSASTTNGRVNCELAVDGTKKRTRVEGTLNGGGSEIDLDTTNGSIDIVELPDAR